MEETILAADVADDLDWRGVNGRTIQVIELSKLLRGATYHARVERDDNFRSTGSAGMKINNLRKSHPAHHGVGLRATEAELEVVQLFLEDRASAKAVAAEMRKRITGGDERLGDAKNILRAIR